MQHKKSSEVNILFFSKKKKYIYIYIESNGSIRRIIFQLDAIKSAGIS